MSHQIIRQPNGKFALWSGTVDDFVAYEGTRDQIVNLLVKWSTEKIEQDVDRIIGQLEKGGKPYFQFTMTWEEACEQGRAIHGEEWKPLYPKTGGA